MFRMPPNAPLPCVLNPRPTSTSKPHIIHQLKKFTVKEKEIPANYPYELHPNNSSDNNWQGHFEVKYHTFEGDGEPPNDIGVIGDVYLDRANTDIEKWIPILYTKTVDGWMQWPGQNTLNLFRHPQFSNFCLWSKAKWQFGWMHPSKIAELRELRKIATQQAVIAKKGWEHTHVQLLRDGQSLTFGLSLDDAEGLEEYLSKKKRKHIMEENSHPSNIWKRAKITRGMHYPARLKRTSPTLMAER